MPHPAREASDIVTPRGPHLRFDLRPRKGFIGSPLPAPVLAEDGNLQVDVFDISPPRSGNTWLAWCLEAHPAICVGRPPTPGPHKAPEILPAGPSDAPFVGRLDAYCARYHHALPDQRLADVSTYQLTHARRGIPRIREHNPDARIVAVLRDPIARLHDHYHAAARHDAPIVVPTLFQDALDIPGFLDTSRYATYLQAWHDAFGAANVHVLLDSDLRIDPRAAVSDLYRFLGVADQPLPEHLDAADALLPGNNGGGPEAYRSILRSRRARSTPRLPAETLRRLQRHLAPEIDALEALLGRDLEAWRAPPDEASATARPTRTTKSETVV